MHYRPRRTQAPVSFYAAESHAAYCVDTGVLLARDMDQCKRAYLCFVDAATANVASVSISLAACHTDTEDTHISILALCIEDSMDRQSQPCIQLRSM